MAGWQWSSPRPVARGRPGSQSCGIRLRQGVARPSVFDDARYWRGGHDRRWLEPTQYQGAGSPRCGLLNVPRSDPNDSPEHLVMCLSLPFVLPSVGPLPSPAYVLVPCLMRPRSRGSVKLASGDPRVPALIDPNSLSEPADLDLLVEGVSLAREIGAGAAFADWRAQEVYPGPEGTNATDILKFFARQIRSTIPLALAAWGPSSMRPCALKVWRGLPAPP